MTATHHARTRVSLRDRFRRTRKPGTTPVATDGQDVIGTAPAMPAAPAIGGVDPDWKRLDALREASRRTPGATLPGSGPARAAAFADTFHGHAKPAASPPWAGAQIPDMEAPRDPYEDPGATTLLSAVGTPPPRFVPGTEASATRRSPDDRLPIHDHLRANWETLRPVILTPQEPSPDPAAEVFLAADYAAWVAMIIIVLIPMGEGVR